MIAGGQPRSDGRRTGLDDRYTSPAAGRRRPGMTSTQPLSGRLAGQLYRSAERTGASESRYVTRHVDRP